MKTIHASVLPNRFDSRLLENRRYRPHLDTAAIKRQSRRQERRIAQHRLRKDIAAQGTDFVPAPSRQDPLQQAKAPVVPVIKLATTNANRQASVVVMFPRRETTFPAREITIVRKRPFQRASVETMLLAA